jgi:hypothetical protein
VWQKAFGRDAKETPAGEPGRGLLILALIAFVLGLTVEWWLAKLGGVLPAQLSETAWGNIILNLGLITCLLFAVEPALHRMSGDNASALPAYSIIFLLSAVFHNLSVNSWLWTHHNNPLIYLALVFVMGSVLAPRYGGAPAWTTRFSRWLTSALLCFVILALWPLAAAQMRLVQQCTDPWPEVKHLAGAKLRPDAEGMRALVHAVRAQVNPDDADTALLLPEDPNVEAWFERPRPELSSAIVFTDQYWDRYVDEDFAALRANPPKVIVIGPANYWRLFSRKWNRGRGAERLIDRIQAELLPQAYDLQLTLPITFQGGPESMQLFVRRQP